MNKEELQLAIEGTKERILVLKTRLENSEDIQEKKALRKEIKDLQYLQLWHIEHLGNM